MSVGPHPPGRLTLRRSQRAPRCQAFIGTPYECGSGVARSKLRVNVASVYVKVDGQAAVPAARLRVVAAAAGAVRADQQGVCDKVCV
jgi:hypothetical protein